VVTIYTASFNIHKFYVLPIRCIYAFCVDLRTKSDYLFIYLYSIKLRGFIAKIECLLRGTNWVFKSDRYLFTYLLTYFLTYLLTYFLHGTESFLRS